MRYQRLAVLGGDDRQLSMLDELQQSGREVRSWGLGSQSTDENWRDAVGEADAVILPLPASGDGVRIHCPLACSYALRFSTLLEQLRPGSLILGGRLSQFWLQSAEEAGMQIEDYYLSDLLQLRNALPTAEAAIYLALQSLPVTLCGCTVAVLGYGRIASLLASRLHALGAEVTVFARKERDITHAALYGLRAVQIKGEGEASSLRRLPAGCRVIFNTVPSRILTEPILQTVPRGCLLIELASSPGSFDPAIAERLGLRWMPASGLPGRYFPESAGRILGQCLLSRLDAGSV